MFRDRTNLYLSYRRTIPRSISSGTSRFDSLMEEEEGLIESRRAPKFKESNEGIELKPMTPSMFDISGEIDSILDQTKAKTHELSTLYKKLLITSQGEKKTVETKIDELTYNITKKFEGVYVLIKKFEFLQKNYEKLGINYTPEELSILENLKKNYALKIQESTLVFRNMQNNYIKFLRDDVDESEQLLGNSENAFAVTEDETKTKDIEDYSKQILMNTQVQMKKSNTNYLQEREREISKLAMGILEISTIFKEMESLIVDQGSILDRIDYNLSSTVQDLKLSDKELLKAQNYQKRTTKCKIIFLLSLVVFALFLIVLIKPHGSSKPQQLTPQQPAPEQPAPQPPSNQDVIPEHENIPGDDLTNNH